MIKESEYQLSEIDLLTECRRLFKITNFQALFGKFRVVKITSCVKRDIDMRYGYHINEMVRRWNWEMYPFCALVKSSANRVSYRFLLNGVLEERKFLV